MHQAEIIQAADQRLRQAGLFPKPIIADGHKHRCPVEGTPKGQDGEYRIYADEYTTSACHKLINSVYC